MRRSGALGHQGRQPGAPRPEAILFDAGLTLLHNVTSSAEMAARVLHGRRIEVERSAVDAAMKLTDHHLEHTWRQGDWWASEQAVQELFVEAYQIGLRALPALADHAVGGTGLPPALAAEMYRAYADAVHWALYPDVRPTFDRLREAGITLGVVSDWGHGLEALVLELGLADDLSFVVVSSRLGIAKPDPHVFELALSRIGVPAERALYVGDTYVKDVLGARAAGIEPVLLDRRGSAPPTDCAVIDGLDALLGLLGLDAGAESGATL